MCRLQKAIISVRRAVLRQCEELNAKRETSSHAWEVSRRLKMILSRSSVRIASMAADNARRGSFSETIVYITSTWISPSLQAYRAETWLTVYRAHTHSVSTCLSKSGVNGSDK